MKIKDFEAQIQKDFDKDLTIRTNPNHSDIAGVYWKDIYIGVSLPPEEIHKNIVGDYKDSIGVPYKNIDLALEFIKGKLAKFKKAEAEDPDLFVDEEKK